MVSMRLRWIVFTIFQQVEQRVASNINQGVDATANKISEWRQDAHNLGQAATDKVYGAANAVRKLTLFLNNFR